MVISSSFSLQRLKNIDVKRYLFFLEMLITLWKTKFNKNDVKNRFMVS